MLFGPSLTFNDFDYCLVHMCERDPEYLQFYIDRAKKGRIIFLDNSVFELGESVTADFLLKYARMINPTHIVPPDVLHNGPATVASVENFIARMKEERLEYKIIAVAQGKTEQEYFDCYSTLVNNPGVSVIAIPYDVLFYDDELIPKYGKEVLRFVEARHKLINRLIEKGLINREKHHHLLGCSDPIEFIKYRDGNRYDFIVSVDTSCPIIHGYFDMKISYLFGLRGKKKKDLLANNLDVKLTIRQMQCILYNIEVFKYLVAQEKRNVEE